MHLPADSPSEWLARHVCTHLTPEARGRAVPTTHLIEGGWLAGRYANIAADASRRVHLITELSAWYAGTIAMELGYAYVGAGAGFLPRTDQIGWVLHDGGWAEGVVFGPDVQAVVLPGHPWEGRPDVVTASDRDDLRQRTVDAIVALAAPIVVHLAAVTGAGRGSLWHQVGDALPEVLTWDEAFPVDAALVEDFRWMLDRPGVPWKRKPALELIDESFGSICIEHRGGCCYAYHSASDEPGHDQETLDDDHRLYYEALPETAKWRSYCLTCRFRSYEDSRERQLWWRRHHAAKAAL